MAPATALALFAVVWIVLCVTAGALVFDTMLQDAQRGPHRRGRFEAGD